MMNKKSKRTSSSRNTRPKARKRQRQGGRSVAGRRGVRRRGRLRRTKAQRMFARILETAEDFWLYMYARPGKHSAHGLVTLWGKKLQGADLTYEPRTRTLRFHAIIADQVGYTPFETFFELLFRSNAAYPCAKVYPCREHKTMSVDSQGPCFDGEHGIRRTVHAVMGNFNRLVNDENLHTALAMSGARILGTDIAVIGKQ